MFSPTVVSLLLGNSEMLLKSVEEPNTVGVPLACHRSPNSQRPSSNRTRSWTSSTSMGSGLAGNAKRRRTSSPSTGVNRRCHMSPVCRKGPVAPSPCQVRLLTASTVLPSASRGSSHSLTDPLSRKLSCTHVLAAGEALCWTVSGDTKRLRFSTPHPSYFVRQASPPSPPLRASCSSGVVAMANDARTNAPEGVNP